MYVVSSLAYVLDPFQATDGHDALFSQEYEEQQTPEAKFVKDLDRLELTLQTVEYERGSPFPFSAPPPALPLRPSQTRPNLDLTPRFSFFSPDCRFSQHNRNGTWPPS